MHELVALHSAFPSSFAVQVQNLKVLIWPADPKFQVKVPSAPAAPACDDREKYINMDIISLTITTIPALMALKSSKLTYFPHLWSLSSSGALVI